MMALLLLLSAGLCGLSTAVSNLVVVRQDKTATGYVEKYEIVNGTKVATSAVNFVFDWPLVEMTHDANTDNTYIVTYPEGYPGPVLYQLDSELNLIYAWEKTPYSFFDLQYSPVQSAMYGILVTTTYGRVLSNFTLDQANDLIIASELYTLPYMWYVNASTFDAANSRYFALINNFPGFENSTLDQQLIVADFSQDAKVVAPNVGLFPISSYDLLVQFVAYAPTMKALACAGMNSQGAQVAYLDETTGKIGRSLFQTNAVAVGPLVSVPTVYIDGTPTDKLLVYVKTANTPVPQWDLWSITLTPQGSSSEFITVETYRGHNFEFFAAATAITM